MLDNKKMGRSALSEQFYLASIGGGTGAARVPGDLRINCGIYDPKFQVPCADAAPITPVCVTFRNQHPFPVWLTLYRRGDGQKQIMHRPLIPGQSLPFGMAHYYKMAMAENPRNSYRAFYDIPQARDAELYV